MQKYYKNKLILRNIKLIKKLYIFCKKKLKELEDINYNELLNLMRERQVILIDVRSKQEYLENHLSGSINIPVY